MQKKVDKQPKNAAKPLENEMYLGGFVHEFFENVKKVLLKKIQTMASCPEPFVRNPGSDFTRKRKLDFETTIRCLIAMESGSLKKNCWSFSITILTPQRHQPLTSSVKKYCRKRWNFSFKSSTKPLHNIKHTVDIACSPVMAPT